MTTPRTRKIYLTTRQHAALVRHVHELSGGRGSYDDIAADLTDSGILPIWTTGTRLSPRRHPLTGDDFARLLDAFRAVAAHPQAA